MGIEVSSTVAHPALTADTRHALLLADSPTYSKSQTSSFSSAFLRFRLDDPMKTIPTSLYTFITPNLRRHFSHSHTSSWRMPAVSKKPLALVFPPHTGQKAIIPKN